MEWDKFVKRYVWDDDKTPYLLAVDRLTRRQARHELTACAIFLVFLFGVVAVASLSAQAPHGRSPGTSMYAFTVVCAAVLLGLTRHHWAALWCASAPPAVLVYIWTFGFHPGLVTLDHVVITVFTLLWLRYSLRVVKIAGRYESMPPGEAPPRDWSRWNRRG